MKKSFTYSRLIQALIVYSILVFLWGAWVRISGSGDGCGEHWPFCYGQLIPDSTLLKLWIENFHRISTKLYGFFVIGLVIMAFRWAPKGHAARKGILWTLCFTLTEGLIGAVLVLKGFVANDDSPERAIFIALHLINTFLLMACLFYTWFVSRYNVSKLKIVFQKNIMLPILGVLLFVGGTGAIAALSTTLFPSTSLLSGISNDFQSGAHFLLRLRIVHPILAFCLVILGFVVAGKDSPSKSPLILVWRRRFLGALTAGFFVGLLTLGLLSPLWLKLTHLLTAHVLWLSFCGFYLVLGLPDTAVKQIAQQTK